VPASGVELRAAHDDAVLAGVAQRRRRDSYDRMSNGAATQPRAGALTRHDARGEAQRCRQRGQRAQRARMSGRGALRRRRGNNHNCSAG
jgi:hypothetical protein